MMLVAHRAAAVNTVTVTTLLDSNTPGDGMCSLREAVANINTQSEGTMGDCATGLSTNNIAFGVTGTITLSKGVISLGGAEASVSIEGSDKVALDGGGTSQIFDVNTLVYLNDLTITNGFGGNGGAIVVVGALRATHCSFVASCAS